MRHVFALFFVVFAAGACVGTSVTPTLAPDPAHVRFDGAVVIDVRTDKEHAAGHLKGDHHIPFDQLDARAAEVAALVGDKDKAVVVYCGAGVRAQRAKEVLERQGYTHVQNGGGYDAIVAALPARKAD